MGVEASSLNGIITLCIENKAEMPGLAGMIRTAFEKEDITLAIDEEGRLVIQRENGRQEALRCGEVTTRPARTE